MGRAELPRLSARAWAVWEQARATFPNVVVAPSVPVLYFGNADAYATSDLRVVSVGLNPSVAEFPSSDPFERFPRTRRHGDRNIASYMASLNRYFETSPYRSWFGAFEPLLNGLGASYYLGALNTALHTDLCSPVATDPTWSRLTPHQQRDLIAQGRPLWHDLVRVLKPDLLLVSVARRQLRSIEFGMIGESREIQRLVARRRRPYVIEAWRIQIDPDNEALVVFGEAAQRPFGKVRDDDKYEIGRRVREVLNG